MSGTIHRFMAQFFHGHDGLHIHRALHPSQHGIPDGSMEKLPSPDERLRDRYYARDPHTRDFIETRDPCDRSVVSKN